MSEKTVTPKPLAKLYQDDVNYIAERINVLNTHAVIHEGEPCAKICRARIGGILEVLNFVGLEVKCDWAAPYSGARVMKSLEYLEDKYKWSPAARKEGK